MDCSPPGFSVHGISYGKILEWAAISFSKEIFLDQGWNPNLLHWSWILYSWATRKAHSKYCCSIAQSYLALCGPMDWSTPGFPVLHHLLELAQTHVSLSWTARRSNQSILKKINPEYSLEGQCCHWSSNTLTTWFEGLTHQSDFGIEILVMFIRTVISCVVGKGCLLWPVCSPGKTLLAFALLHFVLQDQTCLLLQVISGLPTFAFQSPGMKRAYTFGVSSRRSCRPS